MTKSKKVKGDVTNNDYSALVGDISSVLENARKFSARALNSILTSAYWLIGRRIVEYELRGLDRSDYYGDRLVEKLAEDLSQKFGRGFGKRNVFLMKSFYLYYSNIFQTLSGKSSDYDEVSQSLSNQIDHDIVQTLSAQSFYNSSASNILQTPSAQSYLFDIAKYFPLPWSHYVRLLTVKDEDARKFYETEALRSGWSVRQLDCQISSQFYERTLLSKNKAAMLKKGAKPKPQDLTTVEEEIKDPYILEFLGLKDEYSESDLQKIPLNSS